MKSNDGDAYEDNEVVEESNFCTLPRYGPNAFTIRQVKDKKENRNHFFIILINLYILGPFQ